MWFVAAPTRANVPPHSAPTASDRHLKYISTRGTAPDLAFDDVLLAGLAADGGLYVPAEWPKLDLGAMKGGAYADVAIAVMRPFVAGTIADAGFDRIVRETYAAFEHPDVAPLVPLGENHQVMELFHGPTLAFKDFALQLVGRLFDHVLAQRGERLTIVGATSGDTGSAAIEACRDRDAVDIFILHPHERVSEVQRRQMTTALSANVHNIAVEGTFDDCQDLVKALFADEAFRTSVRMSAVNSINWARIMAQIVYYVWAWLKVGEGIGGGKPLTYTVPTGNFGNVFAGYAAMQSGLPVNRFIVASNRNDILTRFFETGRMEIGGVEPSLSPSMDIQVSSNFERFLFDLFGRDGGMTADAVTAFRESGSLDVGEERLQRALKIFAGHRLDDAATKRKIRQIYQEYDILLDPHTAVAAAATDALRQNGEQIVTLATAHPAKFPDAVEAATDVHPNLPPRLADLYDRDERYDVLPNDFNAVRDYVQTRTRLKGAA